MKNSKIQSFFKEGHDEVIKNFIPSNQQEQNDFTEVISQETVFAKAIFESNKVHIVNAKDRDLSCFNSETVSNSKNSKTPVRIMCVVHKDVKCFSSLDSSYDIRQKIDSFYQKLAMSIENTILNGLPPSEINKIVGINTEPVTGLRNNIYIPIVTYTTSWDLAAAASIIDDLKLAIKAMPIGLAVTESLVLYVSERVYRRLASRDYKDASATSMKDKLIEMFRMVTNIVPSDSLDLDEMYLISYARKTAGLAMGISKPLSVDNYTDGVDKNFLFYMKLTPYIQRNHDNVSHIVRFVNYKIMKDKIMKDKIMKDKIMKDKIMKEYLNEGAPIYFTDGWVCLHREIITLEEEVAKKIGRRLQQVSYAKQTNVIDK